MVIQMNVNFAYGSISFGGSTTEWWVQLATAVVFGLGFSTLMILLVTPVWLLAPERISRWSVHTAWPFLKNTWNRARGQHRSVETAPSFPVTANENQKEEQQLPAAE